MRKTLAQWKPQQRFKAAQFDLQAAINGRCHQLISGAGDADDAVRSAARLSLKRTVWVDWPNTSRA
jgi:hypothetical protein